MYLSQLLLFNLHPIVLHVHILTAMWCREVSQLYSVKSKHDLLQFKNCKCEKRLLNMVKGVDMYCNKESRYGISLLLVVTHIWSWGIFGMMIYRLLVMFDKNDSDWQCIICTYFITRVPNDISVSYMSNPISQTIHTKENLIYELLKE